MLTTAFTTQESRDKRANSELSVSFFSLFFFFFQRYIQHTILCAVLMSHCVNCDNFWSKSMFFCVR